MLYQKHRPQRLQDVLGQDSTVKQLESMLQKNALPHCLLFTGQTGGGKTTLARIIKDRLGCTGNGDANSDFKELNCADVRGIDAVREIREAMRLHPWNSKCRVWLIDEGHQLTKDAQSALLKMLEDTPKHVYFFICTTDPQKLLPTVRNRCTEFKVVPLKREQLTQLVVRVVKAEERKSLDEKVVDCITEVADGCARKALVLLEQVLELKETDEQLDAILKSDTKIQAIELARALMDRRSQWADVARILKAVEDDPEQLRRMVLGYAAAILTNGKMDGRAFLLLSVFCDPFYDSGKPGLVRACAEVFNTK